MNKKLIICLIFIFFSLFCLSAEERNSSDWFTAGTGNKVIVHGVLRLAGNTAFPAYIIQDENGKDWYIDTKYAKKTAAFEQQKITIKAVVLRKKIFLANGKQLEDKRILTKIKIEN